MDKNELKRLSQDIDALASVIKKNGIIKDSGKQMFGAFDNLTFAKAWLGKTLGELGDSTPYKNDGKRQDIKDIEPVANKANYSLEDEVKGFNHVQFVDFLRERIESITKELWDIKSANANQLSYKANIYTTECFTDLNRAKIWLGLELGRLRDESIKVKEEPSLLTKVGNTILGK